MDLEKARKLLQVRAASLEELLEICDAIYFWDEIINGPHPILTSGLHSNAYVNLSIPLSFPNLCRIFARRSVVELTKQISHIKRTVDIVVSPTFGAEPFGQPLATQLGARFIYTEKIEGVQRITERFGGISDGAKILIAEDTYSTGKTTREVIEAVSSANPRVEFIKDEKGRIIIAAIFQWLGQAKLLREEPELKVIPLIQKDLRTWRPEAEVCPLCKKRSEPLRPKEENNWLKFVAAQLSAPPR